MLRNCLAASTASVFALGLLLPAVALAQEPSEKHTQQSQAGQSSGLQHSIQSLEQARQQLESASQQQASQAIQGARQALDKLESTLAPLKPGAAAQVTSANTSIRAARITLELPAPDHKAAAQQLGQVVEDARRVHQQVAQEAGGARQQRTGQDGQQRTAEIQVQQPAPQVKVEQPAPQVTVQQPTPQVTIQQPPPQVTMQQPKPDVQVTQAEPQVTVEKQGEPNVTVQQQSQLTEMGRQLVGKDIYGPNDSNIGDIEDVVIGSNARVESVLVDVGGFLGIGSRRVAIPVDKLQMKGDRITSTLTKQEAEKLPEYKAPSQQ